MPPLGRPKRSRVIARIAFVSTYPPSRCGLATYTYDLATTLGEREIVALHPAERPGPYSAEVHHRIRRDFRDDYTRVARSLDGCHADVVSIQHSFGAWGGEDGEYVLDFARALRTPIASTLHALPGRPTVRQRQILTELIDRSVTTVVMSRAAVSLLRRAYGVDAARLEIVAHGVPNFPLVQPDTVKPRLGLEGRAVILSFGLLAPGKGYESAIAALPAVAAAVPSVCYVILGATHPDVVAGEGEAYRRSLEAQARSLAVTDHVRFVDAFVTRTELGTWMMAADIFVTPYPDLDRVVSGSLSYAMSAGKAIVSTPYAYATERLAHGRGKLVKTGTPDGLAAALIELLQAPDVRARFGAHAYADSRKMVWSEIAEEYRRIFAPIGRTPSEPAVSIHPFASFRT